MKILLVQTEFMKMQQYVLLFEEHFTNVGIKRFGIIVSQ